MPPRQLKATNCRYAKHKCVDKVKKLCNMAILTTYQTNHTYHDICDILHSPYQVNGLQIKRSVNHLFSKSECEIEIPSNYMDD